MAKKKTEKRTAKKTAEPVTEPKIEQPVNPEFEKVAAAAAAAEVAGQPKDNRGGAREGAGRPLGLTDEKAKVKNLPQYPSIPIKQGCQALFDLWSSAAKIEQLALSEDEADLLSLPLTQLQEFYFPGILPEIAGTWIMLIFAVTRVVKPRIEIVNKVRKERRKGGDTKAGPARDATGIICHYIYNGKPLHPVPIGEPYTLTADVKEVNCPTCLKLLKNKELN